MNFEVITAVVLQTEAFWDVRPCWLVKVTDVSKKRTVFNFRARFWTKLLFLDCWTKKIWASQSSETSVTIYQSTVR